MNLYGFSYETYIYGLADRYYVLLTRNISAIRPILRILLSLFTVLEDHISLLNRKKGQQNSGCINSSFTSSSYRSDQHPHSEFQ